MCVCVCLCALIGSNNAEFIRESHLLKPRLNGNSLR